MILDPEFFWYLATPYTKYQAGHILAFEHASQVAGKLLNQGLKKVFVPIVHCHPIAYYTGIDPVDNVIWLDENGLLCHMMNVCDGLLVVPMPGWRDSHGINFEIQRFMEQNKPVHILPNDVLPDGVLSDDKN